MVLTAVISFTGMDADLQWNFVWFAQFEKLFGAGGGLPADRPTGPTVEALTYARTYATLSDMLFDQTPPIERVTVFLAPTRAEVTALGEARGARRE